MEIVGINRLDQAPNNALVVNERSLPWLQDSEEAGQWASWDAVWRDVRIVNARGELAGVYNLTPNDLGVPTNRETLKQLIMENAIQTVDADGDGLWDDWEQIYLGDLAATSGADGDPDLDGYSNSDPIRATPRPCLKRLRPT